MLLTATAPLLHHLGNRRPSSSKGSGIHVNLDPDFSRFPLLYETLKQLHLVLGSLPELCAVLQLAEGP